MSSPTNLQQVQDILAKLVAFDTTSCYPNRALIDYVRDYLDNCGVMSEIFASDDGKACLWATIGARRESGIVLAGHTDVVPVEGQKWDSDPFVLTERDDKLFARGAADMKGFIACVLAFVPEFLAADTNSCFHLALTSDEETDMSGAKRLTDILVARGIRPEWIWIGEPTGLSIIDQHKGVYAYQTRITGSSWHSGQPDKGLNAIELAAQFMTIIGDVAQQKQNAPVAASRLDPPYTTFNLGTVAGGTAENIIAATCDFMWQVRPHPGDDATEIAALIEQRARAQFAARFSAFAPQAGMQTYICCDTPPFMATAHNPGAATLKRLLKCDETHAAPFATEAGIFQKLGAGAVVCGPGFIEQAHQPNEYIDKNQLVSCVDLIRAVLLSSSARA